MYVAHLACKANPHFIFRFSIFYHVPSRTHHVHWISLSHEESLQGHHQKGQRKEGRAVFKFIKASEIKAKNRKEKKGTRSKGQASKENTGSGESSNQTHVQDHTKEKSSQGPDPGSRSYRDVCCHCEFFFSCIINIFLFFSCDTNKKFIVKTRNVLPIVWESHPSLPRVSPPSRSTCLKKPTKHCSRQGLVHSTSPKPKPSTARTWPRQLAPQISVTSCVFKFNQLGVRSIN
jgi:hypothetical protein